MSINPLTKTHSEKGQSLTELALVLVVLLVLLAGVVDLGRMLFYYLSLREAAEEGASFGAAYPNHCYQVLERVYAGLPERNGIDIGVWINDGTFEVACPNATIAQACTGKQIEVMVRKSDFKLTMPLIGTFIGSQTIPLEARIRNTILRPACP